MLFEALGSALIGLVLAGAALHRLSDRLPTRSLVLATGVAGALFGNLSYATVRGVTHALVSAKIVTAPTRRAAIGLTVAGYVLFALEAVLIYVIARWTVRMMFY